jgi:hypothetical protein
MYFARGANKAGSGLRWTIWAKEHVDTGLYEANPVTAPWRSQPIRVSHYSCGIEANDRPPLIAGASR